MRSATVRPRRAWVLMSLALAATVSVPAWAGPITPSSYTITTPTEPSYPDDTGTQLTDGLFGNTNIFSAPAAFPWVGWMNTTNASMAIIMTFNFASPVTINSVSIDYLNESSGTFVSLPDDEIIGGHLITIPTNAIPDPSTGSITFSPPPGLTTSSLQIELDKAGNGFHVLIDEVTFDGTVATAPGVPEPSTLGLMWIGLPALAGLGWRLTHKRR